MTEAIETILTIDDVSQIQDGLISKFNKSNLPLQVIPYLVDTSKTKETTISEITEIIQNYNVTHIISDRGFAVIELNSDASAIFRKANGINFSQIDDIISEIVDILDKVLIKKIRSYIIYSYDPYSKSIRRDFRNLREKLSNVVSTKLCVDEKSVIEKIKTIEASSIYRRPGNTGIYPNGFDTNCLVGTYNACSFYGEFLADVIINIIENEQKSGVDRINPYSYNKPQNYEMLKHIRSLEDLITNKYLSIGSVSCFGNLYGREEYLVDVPYKKYYKAINDEISRVNDDEKKEDLSILFYENQDKNKGFAKYEYVCYNYAVYEDDRLLLKDIKLSVGIKNRESICKKWLPLLHTSIFYCKEDSWKDELLDCNSESIKEPVSIVTLLFLIIKLDEDDFHGTFNFTLYSESPNISHDSIELLALEKYSPILESKILELILPHKSKEVRKQATRAAISQVMARNTSHNIGAHVMNKLIGDLSKVEIEKFKNYKWGIELYKDETDINKKLLDQISIFNNYVKCRMDYLADISFGTPLMQTNKYAYADLFKELDKVRLLLEHISGLDNFEFEIKFTRNGKEFKKGNQTEGEEDLLVAIPNDILGTQAFYNILENIIRNSAKHAQKPIEKDKSGNSIKKPTVFTVNFIDSIEVETDGETKRVVDYCECSEVGCTKAHKKEIENALNEFIAVEVYDNIPVDVTEKEIKLEGKEIDEYKRMMGNKEPEFKTSIDYLVFSQNKKLNEDILSKESKLRSYSLGLVEMDASAAYLRKRPVEYINHRSYDIQYDESWSRNTEKNKEEGRDEINHRGSNCRHFLKAFKKTVGDKNYLGYRFFLHRPAVVLVVTELLKDEKKKEKLKKEGIWVVTKEEFEYHLKPENGKNDGKVYPHEFVLIDSNVTFDKVKVEIVEKNSEGQETKRTEEIEFLEYYKTSLPVRVLVQSYNNLKILFDVQSEVVDITCRGEFKIVTKTVLDAWEQKCWENWDNKSIKLDYNGGLILPKKAEKYSSLNDHTFTNGKNSQGEEILFYDDALSTNGQKKLPNFRKDLAYYKACELNFNLTTKLKVGESIYSRVLIIDERIQDNSRKDFSKHFKIKALYEKTGIIVPDYPDINLSATSMDDELINKIKGIIDKYRFNKNDVAGNFERLNPHFDFILLHYSILERMFKSDKDIINDYLKDLGKFNNVVVTSGRGEPDGLPREVRFINLSSAIHALVESRSKYFTNYILHQSRKSSKNQK